MHDSGRTDAWRPQVNGVVRTLDRSRRRPGRGAEIVLTPELPHLPMPTYPEIRLALPRPADRARIGAARPTTSTSRPKGRSACGRGALPQARAAFTPATTRAFRNISGALADPGSAGPTPGCAASTRRAAVMVATPSCARNSRARLSQCCCGRAASTPSVPPARARPRPAAAGLPLMSAAWRPRRTSRRSSRSTCRARRWWSATARRAPSWSGVPASAVPGRLQARSWRSLCRGRRLRVPEPDRHLRHRAARGARERPAGRRLSGHRAARRVGDGAGRRARTTTCARRALRR